MLAMAVLLPQRQLHPLEEVQEFPSQLLMQVSAHDGSQAKEAEAKRAAVRMADFILTIESLLVGCLRESGEETRMTMLDTRKKSGSRWEMWSQYNEMSPTVAASKSCDPSGLI